jgi:hypothetical protein
MTRILILIALAILAVTAAGCGSKPAANGVAQLPSSATTTTTGSQSDGSPTNAASKTQSVARYASCMRSHGVPKFPDPKSSGGGLSLTIGPGSGIDPSSPQFQAADKACRKLMPGGGNAPSPAQQAKALAQMLKFSACMRAHGLPDFPDPTSSGGGIQLSIGGKKGSGLNPSSPVFQAAQKACQSVMPGPKIKGGGGGSTEFRQVGPSTGSVDAP